MTVGIKRHDPGSNWQRLRGRVDSGQQLDVPAADGRWRALPYLGAMVALCAIAFFGLHWIESSQLESGPHGDDDAAIGDGIGGLDGPVVVERVGRGAVLFVDEDDGVAATGDALAVDRPSADQVPAAGNNANDNAAGNNANGGEGGPTDSSMTTTTSPAPTTTRPTTTRRESTAEPQYFSTRGVGASLPSGEWCAARVKPRPEVRSMNTPFNSTRGTDANDEYPRVDGDFTGTTDEIIQWAACKWGIDENVVRAMALVESWWDTSRQNDDTTSQEGCHPSLRSSSGVCPESVGLLQVKYRFHQSAYEDRNAIRSTAYNVDYALAVWRECFEGDVGWLNDVERGEDYRAGDLEGCLGVWYAGRWHTSGAKSYFERVIRVSREKGWEDPDFLKYTGQ